MLACPVGDFANILDMRAKELRALGIMDEVLDDPMWSDEQKEICRSVNGGHLQCCLFRCISCSNLYGLDSFD